MTDTSHLPESIDSAKFSVVRKGYDKREVRDFLQEVEAAFRDMENWSKRAKVRLAEAEEQIAGSQTQTDGSVDNAMFAVFDAKDRILDKARRRAEQIEEEALAEATEIKARAERLTGDGSADDVLGAAREEAQDIIDRAKREAAKVASTGGLDIDALQHEMEQKDEQLSSMRNQLLASKTDAQVASSGDGEMVVQAQAMADQLIREAQDKADRIVAQAESRAADGGDADAAAAAMLESAKQQAAEIEARAHQLRSTAEEVLADAQAKFAAAREAEAAAGDQGGPAPFGDISDDALLTGMQGELAEVHEKVEARRTELTELHDLVEERRNELRDIHDAVEGRKSELADMPSAAPTGGGGFDLSAAQAEADEIIAKAQEEASQVRAEAMRMLAETEQERAAAATSEDGAHAVGVGALEEEIVELQASQAKAQQQSAAWAEVVDELKAQVAEMSSQLEARDSEIEAAAESGDGDDAKQLRAEIATLVMELDSKDAERETATAALRAEGDAMAARVAELTTMLDSSEDHGDGAVSNEEVESLRSQLTELGTEMQAKDEALEAATAALRDESDAFAARVAELTSQVEAKDEEIAAAVSTGEAAAGLEKKVAELTARLEVKDEELAAAASTSEHAQSLETQVSDLSAQLEGKAAESDQIIASLREESEALAGRVGELNSDLEAKSSEIEAKNSELASAAEAADRIASLEAQAADLSSQLEAKSAELRSTSDALREESGALAARVAELSDVIEANVTAHETAMARAARVQPLSQELTKAQVTLREQRGEIEKVAEISSVAQELRGRVDGLESSLAEAKAEAVELPKLRVQVDGLKIRAAQAEEAAEFANSQLTDLMAQAENFEQDAIRRAAAAEAHRIREMTEDSLGIARDATAGTGLDSDDYVPAASLEPVEVTSDPDDWSDVFAAADALSARLAGDDPADTIEAELDATAATEFTDEDVELAEPAEFVEPVPAAETDPTPVAETEVEVHDSADEAAEHETTEVEADEPDSDEPVVAELEVLEPEVAESEPVEPEVAESKAVDPDAVEPQVAEPEDFGELMESVEDLQPFEDLGSDEPVAQAASDDTAAEDTAAYDDQAGDEVVAEFVEDAMPEPVAETIEEETFENPVHAVEEASLDTIEDHSPTEDSAAEDSVAEDSGQVDTSTEEVAPVAEEIAEAIAEPVSEVAGEVPAVDEAFEAAEEAVAPVEQLHPDAPAAEIMAGEHSFEAADIGGEELHVAPQADDVEEASSETPAAAPEEPQEDVERHAPAAEQAETEDDDEVVPMGMAERLRLARAELEAELDPDTVPAQDIPPAQDEAPVQPEPAEFQAVAQPVEDDAPVRAAFDQADDIAQGNHPARETRYARQSAKLPRITESDSEDADDLASMSRFRARMLRGKNKDND